MKKVLFVVIALVLCMSMVLVGCAPKAETEQPASESTSVEAETEAPTNEESAEPAKDEKLKIGFSVMILENPYFIEVIEGFKDACEAIGAEPIVVDAQYDVAKQVGDIENLINQGVDALLIAPIDQNALSDLVEQAKEQGIIVMSEAQPVDNAHAIYTIDEYEYGVAIGQCAAQWINEKLGGEAEVIIISQDNVEPVIQRGNGIQDTIEQNCDNVTVVGRQAGDSPEKGMKIVEGLLQQYPNVKVVVANNDSGALGGYEAVMSMGLASDDFFVGGADATAEALAKMQEEGSVYRSTVDILPYDVGYECVEIMKNYIENGAPSEPEIYLMKMAPVWQEDVLSGAYPVE